MRITKQIKPNLYDPGNIVILETSLHQKLTEKNMFYSYRLLRSLSVVTFTFCLRTLFSGPFCYLLKKQPSSTIFSQLLQTVFSKNELHLFTLKRKKN